MNNIINEMTCEISRQIYWSGFFKGTGLILSIWVVWEAYKYFSNKNCNIKIEISERKEPKI